MLENLPHDGQMRRVNAHCVQPHMYGKYSLRCGPPWAHLAPSVLPYKRRKKPLEIERERERERERFQNRASKGRREEMEEEVDWRGDLAREQKGFVLKVVKLQIHILGVSNLPFHHSL